MLVFALVKPPLILDQKRRRRKKMTTAIPLGKFSVFLSPLLGYPFFLHFTHKVKYDLFLKLPGFCEMDSQVFLAIQSFSWQRLCQYSYVEINYLLSNTFSWIKFSFVLFYLASILNQSKFWVGSFILKSLSMSILAYFNFAFSSFLPIRNWFCISG